MTMLDRVRAYLNEAQKIIPEWRAYVTDQTQPLDDRWEAFWEAPSEWRNDTTRGCVPIEAINHIFTSPYDNFHMDLEVTKSLDDIMDDVQEKFDDGDSEADGLTQEMIDRAKEEIMARNLGNWTYDQ